MGPEWMAEGRSAAGPPVQNLRGMAGLQRHVTLLCGAPGARIKVVESEAGREERAASLRDWEPAPSSREAPAAPGGEAAPGGASSGAGDAPGGTGGSRLPHVTREALAGRCGGAHAAAAHPGQGPPARPEGQAESGTAAAAPPQDGTARAAADGGAAAGGNPVQRAIASVSSAVDALEPQACPVLTSLCELLICLISVMMLLWC